MAETAMQIESNEKCINANELDWIATGEGAWIKVLRVSMETGNWVAMFKQSAGTFVPPHKHLGAAEFYVIEGCIEYRGGKAEKGYYGYEPLGAVHDRTSFPVDTIYILTSYGPLAMRDGQGNLVGVMDSEMMHGLLPA